MEERGIRGRRCLGREGIRRFLVNVFFFNSSDSIKICFFFEVDRGVLILVFF